MREAKDAQRERRYASAMRCDAMRRRAAARRRVRHRAMFVPCHCLFVIFICLPLLLLIISY